MRCRHFAGAGQSAIVRATFSARCVLRAGQPSRAAAACMNLSAAASSAAWRSISAPLQSLVRFALPLDRTFARFDHAAADAARGLSGRRFEQLLRRDRGHLDVQLDAVQLRPAWLEM